MQSVSRIFAKGMISFEFEMVSPLNPKSETEIENKNTQMKRTIFMEIF